MKKKTISEIDKKNWEDYIKEPKDIFDKDLKNQNYTSNYSRFKFDLHGYTLLEANEKVREIINFCFEKKYNELLIITGKGIHSNTENNTYVSKDLSKLRYAIPDYIKSNSDLFKKVSLITQAKTEEGGEGAILIKLKTIK